MSVAEPLFGLAALARKVFAGEDLLPLSEAMLDRVSRDPADTNALMDLSIILQLLYKPNTARSMQERALEINRVYHIPASTGEAAIRLLAIMTSGDLMANTPLDFLLENSDVSLDMLYVTDDAQFPDTIPEHDIAFVAVADSDPNLPVLEGLENTMASWPRPVLNRPARILRTTREGTWETLRDADGTFMPPQFRVSRSVLELINARELSLPASEIQCAFPVIVRPCNSHAGHGLSRLADVDDVAGYLAAQAETEFYVSPYLDYRSRDGLFRKYRIALIDGKPYASHMAISSNWMVHYLNAGMTDSAEKRREEERFMVAFGEEFGSRHSAAFAEIDRRFGLEYLIIDCAESTDGKLIVFEVDVGAVIHAMDPVEMFPYKHVQMKKVFSAFHDMLARRVAR